MVILTILLAPESAVSSVAFAVSWIVGLCLVTGLMVVGANQLRGFTLPYSANAIDWVEILIGIALVAYGVGSFIARRGKPPQTELPTWLHTIGGVRPLPATALALALCLRPKGLLVCSAAALAIGASRSTPASDVIALLIFVGIGASTVLAPVTVSLVRQDAMRRPLEAAERWITRNSRTVTFVAALVIGVVIIGHGMTGL
jgi:hypothetical protein